MENKISKASGEISKQISNLDDLLCGLEEEVSANQEAFSSVVMYGEIPSSVGPGQAVNPEPPQSPLATVLTMANYRINNCIRLLQDLRSKCQL